MNFLCYLCLQLQMPQGAFVLPVNIAKVPEFVNLKLSKQTPLYIELKYVHVHHPYVVCLLVNVC